MAYCLDIDQLQQSGPCIPDVIGLYWSGKDSTSNSSGMTQVYLSLSLYIYIEDKEGKWVNMGNNSITQILITELNKKEIYKIKKKLNVRKGKSFY